MPPAGGARLTAGLRRGEKGPSVLAAVSAGARPPARQPEPRRLRCCPSAAKAERCSLLPVPVAAGFTLLNFPAQSRDLIIRLTKKMTFKFLHNRMTAGTPAFRKARNVTGLMMKSQAPPRTLQIQHLEGADETQET